MKNNEEKHLGLILTNGKRYFEDFKNIQFDFINDANKKIYSSILELGRNNQDIDVLTVSLSLRKQGQLEKIGGLKYLAKLIKSAN